MEDWRKIVSGLRDSGMSDSEIARQITAEGIEVTQPTIWRIRNGRIKRTGYELGDALKRLYAERLAPATKPKRFRNGG